MFNLHLELKPQAYSVASDRHQAPREVIVFHGAYSRKSDKFEGPEGEEISGFYVRIARLDANAEAGIIRGLGDRTETLQIYIETALPSSAFDRVAQAVERRASIHGSFRDNFFDETERPFTRREGYPARLVWDQSKPFAFALEETSIEVIEPEPAATPAKISAPEETTPKPPVLENDIRAQLVAIRSRLTFVAAILLGLLFYVAR